MNRLAIVHTPLAEVLLFRSMQGNESLSSLFHYSVEMVSKDGEIELKSLLGQPLTLQIKQQNAPDHWLNGDITSLGLKGMEGGSSRYYVYHAEVRPKLWYLTQNKDFRIFQEKTVPDIIKEILTDFNIQPDDKLSQNYRSWGYCVQYNESAFDFISRLMEHEGIYYYFVHTNGEHKLVLADNQDAHPSVLFPIIPYRGPNASGIVEEICVDNWQVYDEIKPSFVSMNDYDFHKPYATLLEVKANNESYAPERTEVFEWPGRFIDKSHAEFYTRTRKEEAAAQHEKMHGSATTSMLTPGHKFSLIKTPREADNQEYLLVQTNYTIWDNTYASGEDTDRGQRADFTVIPSSVIWRSPRITPWPKTQGPQTAQVVCPPGETIWTDKYGRVKVKFHWDRYAKGDDTSSCWIRVASAWAGQGYGGVQVPRLNDEVVVDFINGDPDRPLIIGRVYNEANMPPWDLPANATQMGFFSRSKTGHKGTANALRFEDKMGEEEVWIHAEKDMNTDIENNEILDVGVNRTKIIGQDETNHIKHNRIETVDADETITIHKNRTETVGQNEAISIGQNRSKTVGKNDNLVVKGNQIETVLIAKAETIGAAKALSVGAGYQVTVGAAMNTSVGLAQAEEIGLAKKVLVGKNYDQQVGKNKNVQVSLDQNITIGKKLKIDVGELVEIKCGSSTLTMDKSGRITLNGKTFNFDASGAILMKGSIIDMNK